MTVECPYCTQQFILKMQPGEKGKIYHPTAWREFDKHIADKHQPKFQTAPMQHKYDV
jgi:hypothetical protein